MNLDGMPPARRDACLGAMTAESTEEDFTPLAASFPFPYGSVRRHISTYNISKYGVLQISPKAGALRAKAMHDQHPDTLPPGCIPLMLRTRQVQLLYSLMANSARPRRA